MNLKDRPVLVFLIGSFIAWALSLIFPQQREWWGDRLIELGQGIALAWTWLSDDVPIPRGVVGVAAVLAVWLAVRSVARALTPAAPPAPSPDEGKPHDIGADELAILKMLAERDGQPVFFTEIQTAWSASQLRVERSLEVLQRYGLITWNDIRRADSHAFLTPKGREVCHFYGWLR